jgi:hypothetical protein
MTTLENSDIVVYPAHPTININKFVEFQRNTLSRPLIVFFNDDSDQKLPVRDNTYIFRTSFYKSTQLGHEYALPGWSADFGTTNSRKWAEQPVISFCGQLYPLAIRKMALRILKKDPRVICDFIERSKFWGDAITNPELSYEVRKEFIENINNGDYVLCARGGGNFSYRLYETMMSGRIPLFIDTDCVLPFDNYINWNKLFPVVKINEINNIVDILLEFHNKSKENFIEIQNNLRRIWEEWLSPYGFFKNINRVVKEI